MPKRKLNLKNTTFEALLTPAGLAQLDTRFLAYLHQQDAALCAQLKEYRTGASIDARNLSELLLHAAPYVESFIAELFDIETAVSELKEQVQLQDPIFKFKKHFVLREAKRALKKVDEFDSFTVLDQWLQTELKKRNILHADRELAVAHYADLLLQKDDAAQQQRLIQWCVRAMTTDEGSRAVADWVSFHFPQRLNYANLVEIESINDEYKRIQISLQHFRQRDGFNLSDESMSERQVLDEIHYCVYCHKNDGDFCSKGFPVKKGHKEQGLKVNPLRETLTGCPLEEKISEMNFLKKSGFSIAPLAVVMIDNPMCPATGHRICNDCMKACIYQKQEPVDIPQIETRVLLDVLNLPWGVEIYDLLTRWNPLSREQWLLKPYNGKKVLVMGMGPAGFTLAHYLLNEGCAVVGVDGLKLEPLPQDYLDQPIYSYQEIKESLDDRIMAGFGGVAEYGITIRWDKNFLKLIYISLMRRQHFQVYGSVRFGGTLTVDDAWSLGFDHLALAVGAGLPRELPVPNSMAPGMRQANDFLMALQLTGAAKFSSLANLQVRLPAVVIGGGLTGIDTATEVSAYYLKQIEKIAYRYEILCEHQSEATVRERFDIDSLEILDEFLKHADELASVRNEAKQRNESPDLISLLRRWGGVTIAYRRALQESPAYRRNHEEVNKAFEEGIYYAEGLDPAAVMLDQHGFVDGLKCHIRVINEMGEWQQSSDYRTLPAKSIFVATGAKPNIAYEFEHRGTFQREGDNYQRFEHSAEGLKPADQVDHVKSPGFGAFTSFERDHHRVSFLGDTHPVFHGSVVKAIASAKRIYPKIMEVLSNHNQTANLADYRHFHEQMDGLFSATVVSVKRLADDVVELKVRAPMAARNFLPGQFYRIQNYETHAAKVGKTCLQTEAMAMIGARDLQHQDQLSFFVLERGVSSRLVATFTEGEQLAVMGPTGVRSKIPTGRETVMILGGTMAMATLRSLAPALHQAGHRVLLVACMEHNKSFYDREQLEQLADAILWVTAQGMPVPSQRPQDRVAEGELVLALRNYALGQLGEGESPEIALAEVDRVIAIGSAELLARIQQARNGLLQDLFSPNVKFFASVYGAMQCMLKGVCAQCLQWQIDPETGERTKAVYACSWQEQPMEVVDISNIEQRLQQNRVAEILGQCWLDYLIEKYAIIKV